MKSKLTFLPIILYFLFINSFLYSQDPGDVNNDETIDIVDALLTAQYYVGLNPENFDPVSGDSDCDGNINIVDALLIAQFYVVFDKPAVLWFYYTNADRYSGLNQRPGCGSI